MAPDRKKQIVKRRRITWFDDWREWFGPREYGIGWTAKTWKGAVALGVVVTMIALISMTFSYYFS